MTYKEKLILLRNEFAIKTDLHLKADQELYEEGNGFFDEKLLNKFIKTKQAFEVSANNYNTMLSYIVKNKLDLNAEFME